jgi:hypothetical protein
MFSNTQTRSLVPLSLRRGGQKPSYGNQNHGYTGGADFFAPPRLGQTGHYDPQGQHRGPYQAPVGDCRFAPAWEIWCPFPIRSAINLRFLDRNDRGTWPWPRESGHTRSGSKSTHLCKVMSAKTWSDGEGKSRVDLTTTATLDKTETDESHDFQWLHVQTEHLDFDEFQTIALNAPGLSRDWKLVVLGLLDRIRRLNKSTCGRNWLPWSMRTDSLETTMPKKHDVDLSAISISFPYFALGSKKSQATSRHLLPGSGLFESILDRNFEQLFHKMVNEEQSEDSYVYTSHVWCITFDKCNIF